jgi:dolichol-phosphate mannosyltransferase/undecaprenyl-phosphate 4-deoxy-4-formamido-L-arabinose transferase
MAQPEYSVIIPVFNSDESLIEITHRLVNVFTKTIKAPFEIIFVDDASPNPNTWKTLEQLSEEFPNIIAIQLQRNFGRVNALLCGMDTISGQYVIIMDDDLQHAPEDIPVLLTEKEHDVVMGASLKKNHTFQQRVTSNIKSWFDAIALGKPRHIHNSAFMLLKADIVQKIRQIKTSNPILSALILFTTRDVTNVWVNHFERKYGHSNFNVLKRWALFTNLLINNSDLPLKLLRTGGLLIFILNLLLSLFYVYRRIIYQITVPGFTTLVIVNLMMGGLILLSLGIIGEYIYRLLVNVEQKPAYIVRTALGKSDYES